MDDHVEQEEVRDIESVDAEIIKGLFKQYDSVMKMLPDETPPDVAEKKDVRNSIFVIDHRDDPNTIFKGEEVHCFRSAHPIQDHFESWLPFHTHMDEVNRIVGNPQKNEQWITVTIKPGDLYRPKFAKERSKTPWDKVEEDEWWLGTDELVVAFSNTGKAIEAKVWWSFGKLKTKRKGWVYGHDRLKEARSLENLPQIDFGEVFSEPPKPLSGTTLERLKYIAHQASLGNISEWGDVFKHEEIGG